MKNFAKRFSAMLLSLALVLTMMPLLAFAEGEGSDKAFDVAVNGTVVGSIDKSWMEKNKMDPQVYPWPANQGTVWKYVRAEGPGYEAVIKEALGLDSLDYVNDGEIKWMKEGAAQGKFFLKVGELAKAKTCYKLMNGETEVTIPFAKPTEGEDVIAEAKAVTLEGAADVTPIIGTKAEMFDSYADAKAATGFSDKANTDIRPYVGGDLTRADNDLFLKKDGAVKPGAFNFLSKFSMVGCDTLNILIDIPAGTGKDIIFSNQTPQQAEITFDEDNILGAKLIEKAEWTSSDEKVATVGEKGIVTPVGVGTCSVTAKAGNGDVLGTVNVTVSKEAFPSPEPSLKDGQIAKVGGNTYQVVSAGAKTAAFKKAANKKSATVPATVKINGQTLKVTTIAPKAFKGTKVKTLTVKSKKLTKKSVKGSLKGSKVKTVKIKVGKKKDNKKYVKKYKKIFTKKNAGKKVTVK